MEGDEMFNPSEYIKNNSYQISNSQQNNFVSMRCIDDREHRQPKDSQNPLPNYGIPGAGLGVFLDILAATQYARHHQSVFVMFSPQVGYDATVKTLGHISAHTDEKNADIPDSPDCAGCGYCMSSINNPHNNFLTQREIHFLKREILPTLKERCNEFGQPIVAYNGSHRAKAVMIIEGEKIGLSSTGQTGHNVYVYHSSVHQKLLATVAERVFPHLEKPNNYTLTEWQDAVLESSKIRVNNIVETLAKELPKYRVFSDGSKIVGQDMETKMSFAV